MEVVSLDLVIADDIKFHREKPRLQRPIFVMAKRIRRKIGDVIQIDLPNGKYAYGRLYDDAGMGIYREITDEPGKPPIGSRDFMFNVGIYNDIITSGKCPVVGRDSFENEEDAYPPPSCVKDKISGEFRIYHKGEMRKSTSEECEGLEIAAVWDLHHIVNRIMSNLT